MVIPLKKKSEPSLLDRIREFRAECDRFIEAKAQELKMSRDGADLPLWDLRRMLVQGDDSCHCRSAARLLGGDVDVQ